MYLLKRVWVRIINLISKVTLLISFFIIILGVIFTAYYMFVSFDFYRVIAGSVGVLTSVKVNKALQGG